MLHMDGRLIISGQQGLSEYLGCRWSGILPFEGADVMCAGRDALFCAARDGLIWRLNSRTLTPEALFFGGPRIRGMCLSKDGKRLYVLCGDADSVLMCCARSGQPLLINRAGVNPQSIALDECGETIIVAGGECAKTLVYRADTLTLVQALPMPGAVMAAAAHHGAVYSLCMDEQLSSLFVTEAGGVRSILTIPGYPGGIFIEKDCLCVSVCGEIIRISQDGGTIRACSPAPGTAKRMIRCGGSLWVLDRESQRLYTACSQGFMPMNSDVCDAVCIKTD